MKRNSHFLFVMIVFAGLILLQSCNKQGPAGPAGPQGAAGANGAAGTTGAAGPQGAKGDTGTANVIYSAWIWTDSSNFTPHKTETAIDSVLWSDNTYHKLYDTSIEFALTIAAPKLTADILNSGTILVYSKIWWGGGELSGGKDTVVKLGRHSWFTTSNIKELNEQWNGTNYVADGSTRSSSYDYFFDNSTFDYTIGALREYCTVTKNSGTVVTPISGYTPPKIKSIFRYVLIPGEVNARRSGPPPVDYNDYQAVCNYYHIPL